LRYWKNSGPAASAAKRFCNAFQAAPIADLGFAKVGFAALLAQGLPGGYLRRRENARPGSPKLPPPFAARDHRVLVTRIAREHGPRDSQKAEAGRLSSDGPLR